MSQICDRLNAIKQKSGLTLTAWAERSGVPVSTISRILSGATENPGLQTVVDLVAAAEAPLSDVLPDLLPPPDSAPAAPSVAARLRSRCAVRRRPARGKGRPHHIPPAPCLVPCTLAAAARHHRHQPCRCRRLFADYRRPQP